MSYLLSPTISETERLISIFMYIPTKLHHFLLVCFPSVLGESGDPRSDVKGYQVFPRRVQP
ncbi:hypothetical protein QQP08_025215 [Theobroma cacao]|nr:hypothetical protein QQP08_025215 [Theobroma cacao]